MKLYTAENIRNIAIAGHGGKGKTTLAEAMLYIAGATDRLGRTADSNTVMDFDAEEKRRKASVSTAVAPLEWKNTKVNIIDTPGLFDFAGGVSEGMRAADAALIVLSAGSGIDVGAEKAYAAADQRGIAKMFAVTRCDAENTDFFKTLDALKEEYGAPICPVIVPYMENDTVKAYVDFAQGKAYAYNNGKATEVAMPESDTLAEIKAIFSEAVAAADDELMEKFFMEEEFTHEEIVRGLSAGIAEGTVYPVFACAGYTTDAVDILLDSIVHFAPAASTVVEKDLKCDENGPVAAICFKTVADPFVGKMSFFKVISGKLTADAAVVNSRTGEPERMGKLIIAHGGKQEDTTAIPAGDIGVITKLTGTITGDTLSAQKSPVTLDGVSFPAPCLS
ncbi:MAG: 50S ribosome-binding GTPase, partial [Clostridia bacterium]|nr:50S ribosome-binding GTPase [Clostridia bacterium]